MVKAIKSTLSFSGFKVAKSVFEIKNQNKPSELDISFGLRGQVFKQENRFKLFLLTKVSDKKKVISINVETVGDFRINSDQIEEQGYRDFIFLNAPAILFPYVRAYITSLTALSGINPIQIPIMNVSSLKGVLEENLVYED